MGFCASVTAIRSTGIKSPALPALGSGLGNLDIDVAIYLPQEHQQNPEWLTRDYPLHHAASAPAPMAGGGQTAKFSRIKKTTRTTRKPGIDRGHGGTVCKAPVTVHRDAPSSMNRAPTLADFSFASAVGIESRDCFACCAHQRCLPRRTRPASFVGSVRLATK